MISNCTECMLSRRSLLSLLSWVLVAHGAMRSCCAVFHRCAMPSRTPVWKWRWTGNVSKACTHRVFRRKLSARHPSEQHAWTAREVQHAERPCGCALDVLDVRVVVPDAGVEDAHLDASAAEALLPQLLRAEGTCPGRRRRRRRHSGRRTEVTQCGAAGRLRQVHDGEPVDAAAGRVPQESADKQSSSTHTVWQHRVRRAPPMRREPPAACCSRSKGLEPAVMHWQKTR